MIREKCGNTNAIAFWFYIYKIIIFERYFEKMRKKKCSKWISAVMSGLVVLGSLSGCGLGDSSEISNNTNTDASTAGDSVAVSSDEILSDTIQINQSEDYDFDAEEIMFLSGVKVSAYTPGVQYALKDIDEDMVSELLVSIDETMGVYAYDETSKQAKLTTKFDDKLDSVLKDDTLVWVDGESQWVDGTIYGVASQMADPGVKTDYYTSINYDWLSKANVTAQGDSVSPVDTGNAVNDRLREMFTDREIYQGEDIERVRSYYDIATNWDKRDQEGIEPLKKYINAIEDIGTISQMDDYLANPELDPFCQFLSFYTTLDIYDTSEYVVKIKGDNFSILPRMYNNEDEESIKLDREEYDTTARYVLAKAGYEDADIDRIMDEAYEIENILLEKDWLDENENPDDELLSPMPLDTMASKCSNFPLGRLFEAYNISGGSAMVEYPEYLRTLDSLYTEENLSKLKSYALVHTAYEASGYLSLEIKNAFYTATELDAEETAGYTAEELNEFYQEELVTSRGIMGVAAENAYMTYFVDDEVRDDITSLAEEIRDSFREILENEDWMSDAGKEAAIAKLDNMEFTILKPDELVDSSYLTVDSESSFLDAYANVTVNTRKHMGEMVGQKRVKGAWRYDLDPSVATTVDNCFYFGAYNQFFIMDAFLNDGTYRKDMSREEKLGTLGEVIGHELTHGFDPNGIQYDKDGNMVVTDNSPYGWMPEEDYNKFMDKANSLADYFSKFTPYPYNQCDGSLYWGEAAADIAGMTIGLNIASKEEGFDYDLYFRIHSKLWVRQSTLIVEQGDIFNEHPLYYLRINATCQQFEEFHETYDIKEGDLMYLAPEDRIAIW